MEAKFKECMKPHALMHSLTGIGFGLLLAGFINGLTGQTGVIIGIILIAAGIIGDYSVNKA